MKMSAMEKIAREVARRLREHGHVAYFAGGCVRDMVRGLPAKDFDIATDATPDIVQKIFPRTFAVGAHFGVVVVVESELNFEVATFRSDGAYFDHRHPVNVRFSSPEEDAKLRTMARSVVVKGVESPERLLDETALFLHRDVTSLPAEKQLMLERLHGSDEGLAGKTVLLVDDDARNIFALSSVLERRAMRVLTATTGSEAIALLDANPGAAIVLTDIMMPGMDGYETIRLIRGNPLFGRLPIVALTAKAMKGDREKCLEAGASDYLAKPVNTEQLLTTLRLWLHR